MEYTITTVESKTWQDKPYKSVTLQAGEEKYDKIGLWPRDPNYASYVEGAVISGSVFKNEKGYWAFKSENSKPTYNKSSAVNKAMDRKEESNEKFQDNKDRAIRLAAAQRDAVLMVTTFEAGTPFPTDAELKAKFIAWRDWFLSEAENRGKLPF